MAQLSESEIIFIVLVGSIGMLALIVAVIAFVIVYQKRMFESRLDSLNKQQEFDQRMIKAQLDSQELERKRIGAELHDSLGSLLWGAKVNASMIQRLSELPEEAKSAHQELVTILDESIDSVRKIAWELTPDAFHHIGFYKSVDRLAKQYSSNSLQVNFTSDPSLLWNDDRALQAFRIVQELLVNAVKHSKATQIHIEAWKEHSDITIKVEDDGMGMVAEEGEMGLGWWSIKKRIGQLNGKIDIGISPTGAGTEVKAIIPWLYGEE